MVFILYSFGLFAKYDNDCIISLEAFDKHGKSINREIVIIKNSNVFVNNEKLSDVEVITQSKFIKNISTFNERKKALECPQGSYRHIFKSNERINREEGCLSDKRYNDLLNSFKFLKKDPLVE